MESNLKFSNSNFVMCNRCFKQIPRNEIYIFQTDVEELHLCSECVKSVPVFYQLVKDNPNQRYFRVVSPLL